MIRRLLGLLCLLTLPATGMAQSAPDPLIANADKAAVVETLAAKLRETYVFPDIADEAAAALLERAGDGVYDNYAASRAFADALRADLRKLGNDRHLQVRYNPSFVEPTHDTGTGGKPTDGELEKIRQEMAENSYGIQRVVRLPGNIGYLDVRFFGPTEFVAPAYEAAMQLLAGSDAVIVDLRSNGGGDPDSVVQLVSHFFARGEERHINSIYSRIDDATREFWLPRSTGTRFTGPVYLVTSDYTFSGGEEFAYDMQTQKRATLVGETTGGGANPGAPASLGHGFYAFIPTGRAINPVTGTNWEHVGVKPDHATSAEEALKQAYRMALKQASEKVEGEQAKMEYEKLLASDPASMAELPGWKHPRE